MRKKPGDTVTLSLEDPTGQTRDATVTLADHPDKPGTGFLGVGADDRLSYPSLPFEVSIDSQRIGGPSAGLAFTLGVLDELTPGDLTGGKDIAATGTISADGTVGPIGGIEQKVTTVAPGAHPVLPRPRRGRAGRGEERTRRRQDRPGPHARRRPRVPVDARR